MTGLDVAVEAVAFQELLRALGRRSEPAAPGRAQLDPGAALDQMLRLGIDAFAVDQHFPRRAGLAAGDAVRRRFGPRALRKERRRRRGRARRLEQDLQAVAAAVAALAAGAHSQPPVPDFERRELLDHLDRR